MKSEQLKPIIKYILREIYEEYGDDDRVDDLRANDTRYEKVKGTVSVEFMSETYEYDYVATAEFYKGSYNGSEIETIDPVTYQGEVQLCPEFDRLPPKLQKEIENKISEDMREKL